MAEERPFDSLYGGREVWESELKRRLTTKELAGLREPGGEGRLIATIATGLYWARLISPDFPEAGEGERDIRSRWWTPEPALVSERYYRIAIGNGLYHVFGFWSAGDGRFTAHYGTSRPNDIPAQDPGTPVSRLRLAILCAAIEQRSAAIWAQRAWLESIAQMRDEHPRLHALAELLREGRGIVEVSTSPEAESGNTRVHFWGLAGLSAYDVNWHADGQIDRVIDTVMDPGQSEDVPRRQLDPAVPADQVVIELCQLCIE